MAPTKKEGKNNSSCLPSNANLRMPDLEFRRTIFQIKSSKQELGQIKKRNPKLCLVEFKWLQCPIDARYAGLASAILAAGRWRQSQNFFPYFFSFLAQFPMPWYQFLFFTNFDQVFVWKFSVSELLLAEKV